MSPPVPQPALPLPAEKRVRGGAADGFVDLRRPSKVVHGRVALGATQPLTALVE